MCVLVLRVGSLYLYAFEVFSVHLVRCLNKIRTEKSLIQPIQLFILYR